MAEPFIGEIRPFAFDFAPTRWARCDGSTLPIPQYQALFALLGTTYGGDGTTNFKLPDLRDRVPMGVKPGTYAQGNTVGSAQVKLAPENLPSHSHTLMALSTPADTADVTGKALANAKGYTSVPTRSEDKLVVSPQAIRPNAGDAVHENRQPYIAVNYCIALSGIWPQRG